MREREREKFQFNNEEIKLTQCEKKFSIYSIITSTPFILCSNKIAKKNLICDERYISKFTFIVNLFENSILNCVYVALFFKFKDKFSI
jgi:hypothetical protein